MNEKSMKILVVEDDPNDCNNIMKAIKNRDEFELIAMTDSDIEALKYVKTKHPDGIILDIELNSSISGHTDSLGFLSELKNLNLGYRPIIIVTTHVKSQRTYDILHRNGVDLILYKDHPTYSVNHVLNKFLTLKESKPNSSIELFKKELIDNKQKISDEINHQLDLIGVTQNLKGRSYIFDAILFLIQNPDSNVNVIQYLSKTYKKSPNTITNGIQNAIIHAWRVSSIEDLSTYYTNKVNHQTGVPTPMEFIYYYVGKVKEVI